MTDSWGGCSKARLLGAVTEALQAESDDVSDQLGAVFGALLQQRLVEQCPPCTLPRIKTQVREPRRPFTKGHAILRLCNATRAMPYSMLLWLINGTQKGDKPLQGSVESGTGAACSL